MAAWDFTCAALFLVGSNGLEEKSETLMSSLEELFAVVMHQKLQCVGRESACKVEESISYQVLFQLSLLPLFPQIVLQQSRYAQPAASC